MQLGSGFSLTTLTDAINKVPHVPGRAGAVIEWAPEGVKTTKIAIEEVAGVLTIVNPTPRGAPGNTVAKEKRVIRELKVPHYDIVDAVWADEVQDVREFGTDERLESLRTVVDRRLTSHVQLRLDPTLEFQRIGAIKGTIVNANGSTLYDLFTEFGVVQATEIDFNFDADPILPGAIRRKCTAVLRLIADALGGLPYTGVYAFCGDAFWDDLTAHPEVRETFLNQQEAAQLRGGLAFQTLDYGGIRFENYRGSIGGTPFINTDKCHFFATGATGLFRTVYAPADWVETANRVGLPRYAKSVPMENGKGYHLYAQMNALSYCTRPNSLIVARRT